MSLDYLNEKIAKQEERLKQLKVQKQLLLVKNQSKKNKTERMIQDVKFCWVLTYSKRWKMKKIRKKYSLK